jgi:general secretion pathway protein G
MLVRRNAFTMIELIFVIVILGILAAVAIPKLAATRSDAEVSKMAQNIMTGAAEIASYAMSQAKTEDNLSVMSNAIANMENSGEVTIDTNNKTATVEYGSTTDCVEVKVETSTNDDNLTISFGTATGDNKCLHLQSAIDAGKYPMRLRGQSVQY